MTITNTAKAFFEPLRSLGFAGISAAYAAVGTPVEHPIRAFCITNNTQGHLIFSMDNTVSAGHMFVAAGSYKLYDVQSNMNAQKDDRYVFPIGTQFYVKQVTAPVTGDVYVEVMC
jgi:hypothetical protein